MSATRRWDIPRTHSGRDTALAPVPPHPSASAASVSSVRETQLFWLSHSVRVSICPRALTEKQGRWQVNLGTVPDPAQTQATSETPSVPRVAPRDVYRGPAAHCPRTGAGRAGRCRGCADCSPRGKVSRRGAKPKQSSAEHTGGGRATSGGGRAQVGTRPQDSRLGSRAYGGKGGPLWRRGSHTPVGHTRRRGLAPVPDGSQAVTAGRHHLIGHAHVPRQPPATRAPTMSHVGLRNQTGTLLLGLNVHFKHQGPHAASAPAQDGSALGGEGFSGPEGQETRAGVELGG